MFKKQKARFDSSFTIWWIMKLFKRFYLKWNYIFNKFLCSLENLSRLAALMYTFIMKHSQSLCTLKCKDDNFNFTILTIRFFLYFGSMCVLIVDRDSNPCPLKLKLLFLSCIRMFSYLCKLLDSKLQSWQDSD